MKKSVFYLSILMLVLPFVLMACAVPGANPPDGSGTLNAVQLYIVGVFASGVTYLLKLVSQKFPNVSDKVKRGWLSIILFVAAYFLSIYWGGVSIPAFGSFSDPVTFLSAGFVWLTALIEAVGPSFTFATIIYNIFMKKVFEAGTAKFQAQFGSK